MSFADLSLAPEEADSWADFRGGRGAGPAYPPFPLADGRGLTETA
jgi:hypothetical protein